MSDFLTNLAARSLGTAEVVRPRVPSLFEPSRRGDGLRPVEPGWSAAHEADEESSGDRGAEPRMGRRNPDPPKMEVRREERVDRQERTPHPPAPAILETPRVRVPPAATARTEEIEATVFTEVRQVEEESRVRQPSSVSKSRHGAPNVVPETYAAGPPAVSGFAPPIPLNVARPQVVTERASAELAPPDTPAVRRLERAAPPSVRAFDKPAAFAERRSARTEPAPAPGQAPIPFSAEAFKPDRRFPEPQIQPPPNAARQTMNPVMPPEIQPPILAARETMARPAAAKAPVAAAVHPRPEPSVQVTIGRVEVRAIFPEAPPARIPAPRARPTVSLDEYLKRAR